jgi:hypothetical protein
MACRRCASIRVDRAVDGIVIESALERLPGRKASTKKFDPFRFG